MIPKEQALKIKQQLIEQIQKTFPENKKQQAIQQVKSLDEKGLEEFLIKNNLIKPESGSKQECVFCSIIFGESPSIKIDESDKAIAVLEINPISKAHALIIPKEHIKNAEKIPKEIYQFAEKVAIKIKNAFNPKDITITNLNITGHEIINLLPIYTNENMQSERKQASEEELLEIQKQLTEIPEKKETQEEVIKETKPKKLDSKNLWLPRRIP